MVTVRELIKELESIENKERIVIMQRDAEGNGYSPLYSIDDTSAYKATTTWFGEVGFEKLTEELKKAGYNEEDIMTDGQPCLVLCPVN